MKKILLFSLLIVLGFGCRFKRGSGNVVSESRTEKNFTGVSTSQGFEIEVITGEDYSIKIDADDNLMKYVVTEIRGKVLKVGLENNVNVRNAHLKARITAPAIETIRASSGASVTVKGIMKGENTVNLDASSGGTITTAVDAPFVSAEASSGSEINLSGRTQTLKFQASSSGSINASALLSENAKVSASSGASVKVHASVKLDASASSGANVKYRGGASVTSNASSGGSVDKE